MDPARAEALSDAMERTSPDQDTGQQAMSARPSDAPAPEINGGEAIARMLRLAGAGPGFGMGGFQLLPFYDAAARHGLTHYLINDERSGGFAADAYARVTGRPGLCDGTLGPGVTNLVTALVEALNAGVPMIALAGDSHRGHSWKNMTQEARQVDILRPAVKEVIRVEQVERLPELIRRAFAVATAGRPGPVLLDIPEDICHGVHAFTPDAFWIDPATLRIPARPSRPDPDDVEKAATLIGGARRPVLLAGGGVHLSRAYDALIRLAERHDIPVAHTLSGKGAIPCTHPLSLGLFGRYSRIANEIIEASDCLIAVGCKLGEVATRRFQLIPPATPLVHLDIEAEEIGRTTRPSVGLAGDARLGLEDLGQALEAAASGRAAYAADARNRMAAWRTGVMARLTSDERPINMARVMHELNLGMPDDAILVADGGFAAHWSGLLYDTKRSGRHYIANRGFASIGYGLPGAIGAQLAAPDRRVVGLTGDGGLNMTIGELETARRCGAPVVLLVVNNAASGYVKALQHAVFGGHYQSADLTELNYADIAEHFGAQGIRVEDPAELAPALTAGLAERSRPTVIDIVVTRDPAKMLPGVDNRTVTIRKGDRIA
jgi:acetolactate synthase-1/2/3 large subunit